ncbi:MAG: hypothetical protein LBH04_11040 [Tannerellaceae bacterium]|jgi:hypothetical protein|nr:hypothetical protein [Tannerellaceae bacterium]
MNRSYRGIIKPYQKYFLIAFTSALYIAAGIECLIKGGGWIICQAIVQSVTAWFILKKGNCAARLLPGNVLETPYYRISADRLISISDAGANMGINIDFVHLDDTPRTTHVTVQELDKQCLIDDLLAINPNLRMQPF